jgi:hypothetical protein
MVEVAFTVDIHSTSDERLFSADATQSEWEQIMGDLDGVGHSPATLQLLAELKRWGLTKKHGCCG